MDVKVFDRKTAEFVTLIDDVYKITVEYGEYKMYQNDGFIVSVNFAQYRLRIA